MTYNDYDKREFWPELFRFLLVLLTYAVIAFVFLTGLQECISYLNTYLTNLIGEKTRKKAIVLNTIRARRPDFSDKLDFLQTYVIMPYLNRAVYTNSGQVDKVPRGLVIHGGDKTDVTNMIKAVGNEVLDPDRKHVRYTRCDISKDAKLVELLQGEKFMEENVTNLVKYAVKNQPSLITMTDPRMLFGVQWTNCETHLPILIEIVCQELAKLRLTDQVFVIFSVDKLKQKQLSYDILKSLKFLHLPKSWTTEKVKTLLISATSKWVRAPLCEILDMMTENCMSLDQSVMEEEVKRLTETAYGTCLDRFMEFVGFDEAKTRIGNGEINPSVEDWEKAWSKICPPTEKSETIENLEPIQVCPPPEQLPSIQPCTQMENADVKPNTEENTADILPTVDINDWVEI